MTSLGENVRTCAGQSEPVCAPSSTWAVWGLLRLLCEPQGPQSHENPGGQLCSPATLLPLQTRMLETDFPLRLTCARLKTWPPRPGSLLSHGPSLWLSGPATPGTPRQSQCFPTEPIAVTAQRNGRSGLCDKQLPAWGPGQPSWLWRRSTGPRRRAA